MASQPTLGVSMVPLGDYGSGFSYGTPDYSQATLDYLASLNQAVAAQPAPAVGNYYNPLELTNQYSNGDVTMPVYATDQALQPYTQAPVDQNLAMQYQLPGAQGATGQVSVGPNTPIILTNDKTGKQVVSGIGFDAAQQAAQAAQGLNADQGGNAAWSIYTASPGTSNYYQAAQSEPQMSLLQGIGALISTAAPLVTAGLGAGIGALTKAGVAAGTSGLGATLQGKSPTDILKSAALAGIGSYAGSQLFPAGAAPTGTPANLNQFGIPTLSGATDLASSVFPGIGNLGTIAGGAGANAISGGSGNDPLTADNTITVNAPSPGGGIGSIGSAAGAAANAVDNTVTISGHQPPPIPPAAIAAVPAIAGIGALTGAGGGAGASGAADTLDSSITVTGHPSPPLDIQPVGPLLASTLVNPAGLGGGIDTTSLTQNPNVDLGKGGILGTGITAAQLPTLATGLTGVLGGIGALVGGNGNAGGGGPLTSNGGTVDIPAAIASAARTANPITFNPFTYGQPQGNQPGEFQFFKPATHATGGPVGYTDGGGIGENPGVNPEPDGDGDDHMFDETGDGAPAYARGGAAAADHARHAMSYAQGGGHDGPGPVQGIGSGQDDKIPAWLSDGEYVWSAQDVADLGDGSTDEGVRRLDKMRQMVRRRAGRKDVSKIAQPQKGIGDLMMAAGG